MMVFLRLGKAAMLQIGLAVVICFPSPVFPVLRSSLLSRSLSFKTSSFEILSFKSFKSSTSTPDLQDCKCFIYTHRSIPCEDSKGRRGGGKGTTSCLNRTVDNHHPTHSCKSSESVW
ncbi:hypothetical protein B0H13DRAFT_1178402 [Mycena leptocephala]|nr:hypothetical protein B0H13DRAFT_1178402 [Mycena leptocephala]